MDTHKWVLSLCQRLFDGQWTGEEEANEVWCAVWKRCVAPIPLLALHWYIARVIRNRWAKWLERRKREVETVPLTVNRTGKDGTTEERPLNHPALEEVDQQIQAVEWNNLLSRLPRRDQYILSAWSSGCTDAEILQVLINAPDLDPKVSAETHPGTAWRWRQEAMSRLRAVVEESALTPEKPGAGRGGRSAHGTVE